MKKLILILSLVLAFSSNATPLESPFFEGLNNKEKTIVESLGLARANKMILKNYEFDDREIVKKHIMATIDDLFRRGLPAIFSDKNRPIGSVENEAQIVFSSICLQIGLSLSGGSQIERGPGFTRVSTSGVAFSSHQKEGAELIGVILMITGSAKRMDERPFIESIKFYSRSALDDDEAEIIARIILSNCQ